MLEREFALTCSHAQKVECLTLGRICKLDWQTCFNFERDELVAVCPAKLKNDREAG